jgi:dienelactone hydrolase
MALGDLHKDASAVFDHASFAMGATWFGSDLAAVSAALRETPAKGIVLFLTGSRQRGQDAQFAEWMPDLSGWLMVAPNTHALSARPSYTSPAEQSVYAQVHHLRVAEIEYCLSRLQALPAFADLPLAIVGLSEGAVAALAWRSENPATRVCLAWPCETTYFAHLPKLPDDLDTPILNIMGGTDSYFAEQDSLSAQSGTPKGHGSESLSDYAQAKVILYPNWGHRILDHSFARGDVMGFLNHHLSPKQKSQGDNDNDHHG